MAKYEIRIQIIIFILQSVAFAFLFSVNWKIAVGVAFISIGENIKQKIIS
jgi:hypothetical protein